MGRLTRVFLLVVVLIPLLGACAQEGSEQAAATQLTATAVDYGFQGVPETIEGGVVDLSFKNDGEATHEFAVIEAEGVTDAEFKKGFGPVVSEGGAFPEFMQRGAAVFEVDPGQRLSSSFTLPEGEYVLFCALDDKPGGKGEDQPTGKTHYDLGMMQRLTVEGTNDAELEAAGGEFVARDYTFDVPTDLKAGKNEYVFRNESDEQWHHMVLNEFEEGVSEKAAVKAFQTMGELEEGEAPPKGTPMPEEAGFAGVMSPEFAQVVELELKAGHTYVAVCFIQDREGGPPHAFRHKMVKAFTVPG